MVVQCRYFNAAKMKNNPQNRLYNKVFLGIIMCSCLESQAVIRFEYFLLSQSEIAFGDCNAAMVE